MAATILGSANGNLRKSALSPKRKGSRSTGWTFNMSAILGVEILSEDHTRKPPNVGPTIDPIDHTSGMRLKALG